MLLLGGRSGAALLWVGPGGGGGVEASGRGVTSFNKGLTSAGERPASSAAPLPAPAGPGAARGAGTSPCSAWTDSRARGSRDRRGGCPRWRARAEAEHDVRDARGEAGDRRVVEEVDRAPGARSHVAEADRHQPSRRPRRSAPAPPDADRRTAGVLLRSPARTGPSRADPRARRASARRARGGRRSTRGAPMRTRKRLARRAARFWLAEGANDATGMRRDTHSKHPAQAGRK